MNAVDIISSDTQKLQTGERVHEGRERTVQHLEERVADGKARRPAQGQVLQNVRHPRAVARRRTKCHPVAP